MKNVLIGLLLFGLVSCNQNSSETDTNVTGVPIDQAPATPIIHYDVVNYWPHSTNAFTEGLLFFNNSLYESTGAPQNFPTTLSAIYKTDINTHQSVVQATIDREKYFGEGMAILNNKVYQLTYQNKLGFIYNLANFKPIGQFSYDNAEGWGLTHDSTYLIMSDGTSQLTYLSTQNMKPVKKINVTENGVLVERLNELEYIKGYIYANIWMTNEIVKIDSKTGKVVGRIDISMLKQEASNKYPQSQETNGIAYNAITDKIYVTGKLWPTIYEIKFNH